MKIGFGSVIELILILLEIYVFTENKNNILVIGILLIAMAIVLYVIISAAINLSEHAKNAQLNRIDDLYEAQKASYIMLKKNFDALSNRLDEMEEANAIPSEEIINAQKAVAKVALSRNKENAIALMESNEMLISQLKSMENLLKEMNSSVGERQEKIFEQTKEELSRRNEELENRIRD
jgi:signal transduction histidine kinase